MASLSVVEIYRCLQDEGISLFTASDLLRRFPIAQANTAYKILQRLEASGMASRVRAGVYRLADRVVGNFALANALVSPSYISLESALSRYGILSQAPLAITSITVKKRRVIEAEVKTFEYSHIGARLFYGFGKEQDYLIATAEKALFDAVYFAAKGLRSLPVDELDLTMIDKRLFHELCRKSKSPQLTEYLKRQNLL